MIEQILQFLQGGIRPLPLLASGIGAQFAAILDVALVSITLLALFRFLRRTRATNILLSFLLIGAGIVIARILNLAALNVLFTVFGVLLVFATPILFQPELRRGLERIGRINIFRRGNGDAPDKATIQSIINATESLRARKAGALIVLERNTGLSEYLDTGVQIHAAVEPSLLVSIFALQSPLHDGAVIIRDNMIAAAACTLPLAENGKGKRLGTRHRAALGITESSDAIAIVVSEEQGNISVASDGRLLSVSGSRHLGDLLNKFSPE